MGHTEIGIARADPMRHHRHHHNDYVSVLHNKDVNNYNDDVSVLHNIDVHITVVARVAMPLVAALAVAGQVRGGQKKPELSLVVVMVVVGAAATVRHISLIKVRGNA